MQFIQKQIFLDIATIYWELRHMSQLQWLRCLWEGRVLLKDYSIEKPVVFIHSYIHFVHYFRFRQFLKDVSKIPLSVGEYESAEKNDVEIFDESDKVTVNDFLETMMSGENNSHSVFYSWPLW